MVFAILSFRIAIMFVLASRYSDKIPIKRLYAKDEDHLAVQRMIGVTLFNILIVVVACFGFKDIQFLWDYLNFYVPTPAAFSASILAILLNCVLYNGNLYYYMRSGEWQSLLRTEPVQNLKTLLVAPFIEEGVFTVFTYMCFGRLSTYGLAYFVLITSIFFGLSHIHMKWNEVKAIYRTTDIGILEKVKRFFKEVSVLVVTTGLFSVYSKVVFLKSLSFWPVFILHSMCNLLGNPKFGFPFALERHIFGIAATVLILYLF